MSAPFNVSQALRHIFLDQRAAQRPLQLRPRALPTIVTRYTQSRQKGGRPAPTARVVRAKTNEQIEAAFIQLVDRESKKLLEPQTRWNVLRSFDPKVEKLVLLQEKFTTYQGRSLALCQIVNIREAQLRDQAKEKAAAAQRRISAIAASVKTLEINWNIDRHDLEHRLNRGKAFLEEGRKVEVVLARKKGGNRATKEQCQELVKQITETLHTVDGVRSDPMQGEYEKVAQISFKNTSPKMKATAGESNESAAANAHA